MVFITQSHHPSNSSQENYPGALIFIEVIISAGFSPRLFFFLFFFPYFSFLFFLLAREFLVGWLLFWDFFFLGFLLF